jgi:non-ribosomal peptide synthetase-like protein
MTDSLLGGEPRQWLTATTDDATPTAATTEAATPTTTTTEVTTTEAATPTTTTTEVTAGEVATPTAAPSPPSPRSLVDVFTETASRFAQRTAIEAPDGQLSYAELYDAAHALAERLGELGIGPGDRVGVYVPSGTAELYVAILGVLVAGAAYVPVDADDPPARAAAIWESSGASAVVQDQLGITRLADASGCPGQPTPHDDAWVIFTSGSTGHPKGVAVTHRSAAAFVDAEAELWEVSPTDRVLAGLSVGFDASCEEMWLAWRHGATLVPASRTLVRTVTDLGPWLAERSVTVISTVPTLAAMWSEADIAGVRLLILGGEACPEALAWRLAAGREVWNTYGPTEATVVSTAARVGVGEPVTIGWPLRGWEVAIVDEDGEPVPLGEPGELAIAGVGLGRYLDPALDAERYVDLPALGSRRAYRTGDIAYETIEGLRFVGRRDDQVKLAGRRLELGEVDAQLSSFPGVKAAATAVQKTAGGNSLLVGYVVGEADAADVRAALAERLPAGIVPLVVSLDSLPTSPSGKVDRKALPWPPPAPRGGGATEAPGDDSGCSGTAAWLAERWADQLGPLPITTDSDFFELGGSSLAAAKLVSALRSRYPTVAVADVYAHRRLAELAARLDRLEPTADELPVVRATEGRRWGLLQIAGVIALLILSSPQWLLGILAVNRLEGGLLGPQLAWGWLVGAWLVFGSVPGRAAIVVLARRLLLPRLKPGRYPRNGWLTFRLWFLERLAEAFRSEALAGTPFAARWARLCGHPIGKGARLGTLPPVTSLVVLGEHCTLEPDVDIHGWWFEGHDLVVGELRIGPGARIGTRTLLAPGAEVGAYAEIEPGSVISGSVPAGERWSGSPASRVGQAGESWPRTIAPRPRAPRFWKAMYLVGLAWQSLLPLLAAAPGVAIVFLSVPAAHGFTTTILIEAPVIAGTFLLTYAVLVALLVRGLGSLIRPGFHPDEGVMGWTLWFTESLMASARGVLFSLYSSIYTRAWLRLAGIEVGRRAEVSTVVGANRLTSFGEKSFAADDVVLAGARARGGWLHLAPIEIGRGTFLGNGAILTGGTTIGSDCLIGVLTTAPREAPDGTSWFGTPALELPRVPDRTDPARTTDPSRPLRIARGTMELVRILLPATISVVLGVLLFCVCDSVGRTVSVPAMAIAAPFLLLAAGVCATLITVAAKWLIMGRYEPGEHPLWSFFVWRDEILNSLQDQLAGTWLLGLALGTPLMSLYLRAMGTKVGRGVWCETLTITEFDVVELGDRCAVNRFSCVETHLFHDRLMRIGPTRLGAGSSLGPSSALLPDSALGAGARVGGRSVVMRGEELPAGTSWHGAPVVSA